MQVNGLEAVIILIAYLNKMPPRGGRGQTEDQKIAALEAFKTSEENTLCEMIFKARTTEGTELKEMHPGTDDVTDDWQPILNSLHKLVEGFKVPGRRAKCKLQIRFDLVFLLRSV